MNTLTCRECRGVMVRKRIATQGELMGCLGWLLLICGGVTCVGSVIMFALPGIMFGAALCVAALLIGGGERKVWRCQTCGTIIERA